MRCSVAARRRTSPVPGGSGPASITFAVHLELAAHSTGSLPGTGGSCPAASAVPIHVPGPTNVHDVAIIVPPS